MIEWSFESLVRCVIAAVVALAFVPQAAVADEGGVSFWLPGTFGSFVAVPQEPGWAFATLYYHTSVAAGGSLSASRQVTRGRLTANVSGALTGSLTSTADLILAVPSYAFASPVLGGQLALSVTGIFGNNSTDASATLTGAVGPFGFTTSGGRSDSVTGLGDLYPQAAIRWNRGAHNFMTYATGAIPVGSYDPDRLANIGVGHGAMDGGAGYTYFDTQKGHEFSTVAGATYNLPNTTTQYQNGINLHLDLAASQFVSEQIHVGVVGYVYNQVTSDTGALPIMNGFQSRIAAIGPQIGYGSFGCTGCHRTNLMNPKKLMELNGVRLGFAQNGHLGIKLVHVTPPVETRRHGTFGEANWSPPDMPLTYASAPLLIDNAGKSDIPELWEEISDARRRTAVARFSSKFRSRRRPLEEPLGQKILRLYERFRRTTGCVSGSYVDAMPYEPLLKDPDRAATYRGLLGNAPPFEPRERARRRGDR